MGDEQETPQGHPAWQELLDALPPEFHAQVTTKLSEWDKKQQDKVQGVHSQYDPYKEFVENSVDPAILKQALFITNSLQNDPEAFVKRAIENYRLEGFNSSQVSNEGEEEMMEWDGEDISQHPQFKAVLDQLNTINSTLTAQQQRDKEAEEASEFETYMEGLKEKHKETGEFDELYVSALMANGVDGDDAVKQFYDTVNAAIARNAGTQQTPETPAPPVVLGGSGNAGSGSPDQSVSMGGLKSGEVQDMVIKMLEQANQQS